MVPHNMEGRVTATQQDKQVENVSLSERLEFAIITGDYAGAEALAETVTSDTYAARSMVRGRVDHRGVLY